MTIQQNSGRIQTTHIGSLPRPHALLDMMKAKYAGTGHDPSAYEATLEKSVADVVRRQVEAGIDIVTDGEFSKPGFFTYVRERLEGFESRPDVKVTLFQQEVAAFPEYYAEYFKGAMMGGAIVALDPVVCVAPVRYRGDAVVNRDIANVKAAARAVGIPDHRAVVGVGADPPDFSDAARYPAPRIENTPAPKAGDGSRSDTKERYRNVIEDSSHSRTPLRRSTVNGARPHISEGVDAGHDASP